MLILHWHSAQNCISSDMSCRSWG